MIFPDKNFRGLVQGLEMAIEFPKEFPRDSLESRPLFIMCHPNPKEGGTMDNKVVTTTTKAMNKLGLISMRFNFANQGESACLDLKTLVTWVRESRSGPIWLGGFSFGSYTAYALANELEVSQLLTIAPAVTRWDYTSIPVPTMPWLCITGDQDEVINSQEIFNFILNVKTPVSLIKFFETGHFFHQRLILLDQKLREYYRGCL